ncbi:hypothetical protein MPLSOD_130062 [Mesorhizobium sp. SOD10]|nr:hypothetical protein MPLSOD_130062 [Mesorhizobium sp. SOD10]
MLARTDFERMSLSLDRREVAPAFRFESEINPFLTFVKRREAFGRRLLRNMVNFGGPGSQAARRSGAGLTPRQLDLAAPCVYSGPPIHGKGNRLSLCFDAIPDGRQRRGRRTQPFTLFLELL